MPMLDPAVHAQLAAVLPSSALLTAAEDTKPYECDGLTMFRELPAAVAPSCVMVTPMPDCMSPTVQLATLQPLSRLVTATGARRSPAPMRAAAAASQ